MLRLALLASGGGSNLQSILDALEDGTVRGLNPVLVAVDRECRAVGRAMDAGIDAVMLDRRIHGAGLSAALGRLLDEYRIDMVLLAGWLSILDSVMVNDWTNRILNIHPALLPKHGGPGMYGLNVHRSVLESGDTVSGCSVHLVTGEVDGGEVLGRAEVPVLPGDDPGTLAARVLAEEHRLYPKIAGEHARRLTPRYPELQSG